jgi:PAS domain S-box-containing protein
VGVQADPLRALLASAPFGVALVDTDLRYIEVNEYLAVVHGRPAAEHPGLTVREVVPGVADELEHHAREVLRTGKRTQQVALRGQGPAGDEPIWLVSMHPVHGPDGALAGVGAVVLDVTQQVRVSQELGRRTRQQEAVARFGQRALAGRDVAALGREAVALLTETLEVELAELLELGPGGDDLLLVAGVGWPDGAVGELRIPATDETQAGMVVRNGAPMVVEDLTAESFALAGELHKLGIVSGASVPIEAEGLLHGVLAAHSTRPRDFSDDDLAFLQAVANVIGAAEERSRAEQRVGQSAQRLELALRAGHLGTWEWHIESGAVRWSETLEAIYGLQPGEFKGTYEDYAARLHPDEREAVLARSRDAAAAQEIMPDLEHRVIWPDGTVHWTLGSGGPLYDDHGRMIGMMGLAQDITERKMAELERAALFEAERAARAEAEAARERLSVLAQITAVLGTTFDVDDLLEKVCRLAVGEFADGCLVELLVDGTLRRAALHHVDPAQVQVYRELRRHYPPRPGSGNPLMRSIETQEPWILPGLPDDLLDEWAEDQRHRALLGELRAGSLMVVPLTGRHRVLGLLGFASDRSDAYNAEALEIARDIARRLGMAIENARLYQERSEGERRFRHLADTLQASLLPPHLPRIPGVEIAAAYRPGARGLEVGGDFYDVFPLRDDQWGIVIGDVCGKGPEAASLTAFARYTLRAAAVQQECPRAAVALVNSAMVRDPEGTDTRFLTLAYLRAVLTPGGIEARLVLAGHPRPLLLRANGAVEVVGAAGTLLGLVEDPDLHEVEVRLHPGDALLLYTDGVPETRNAEDMFGEEGLARVVGACAGLEPQKLLDRVLDALGDFGGGIGRDDRALLCLRVEV